MEARSGSVRTFDPAEGFLSPYFGKSDRVGVCPQFRDHVKGEDSFENGSGGYGYNAIYIGGTPADPFVAEKPANVRHPARTLMFATTAFAKADGLQEYPFAEPRTAVNPDGTPAYTLQPSVHFRFRGKALIAWCDGHISSGGWRTRPRRTTMEVVMRNPESDLQGRGLETAGGILEAMILAEIAHVFEAFGITGFVEVHFADAFFISHRFHLFRRASRRPRQSRTAGISTFGSERSEVSRWTFPRPVRRIHHFRSTRMSLTR